MADLTSIRNALAAQLTAQTGVRAMGQVKDQVSPPVALVLPGNPLIIYGETMADARVMGGPGQGGELTINLAITLLLSDAAPTEKVQRALDAYLGVGSGETQSLAGAILVDPTLGGVVEWAMPTAVTTYGRIEYAAETYFGARINVSVGAS